MLQQKRTIIKSMPTGKLCMLLGAFLSPADFEKNQLFRKILSGIKSECQTVWIEIRSHVLSGLIWVQTVYKGYQQTTLEGKELTCFLVHS